MHRALEQLLRGFSTVYNALRQRVLNASTPNQIVAEHLKAKPELGNPAPRGRVGPCDITKARLIVEVAKEVLQPDSLHHSCLLRSKYERWATAWCACRQSNQAMM